MNMKMSIKKLKTNTKMITNMDTGHMDTGDMDTDIDMSIEHGEGHKILVSHHQANFEIRFQSQFCHCIAE
jgi:hypothetical protein